MNKVKTLFIGTSEFAIPVLEKLLEMDLIDVIGVVTQPDKPMGRKQVLTPMPVKQYLVDKNINISIEQPGKIKEISQDLLEKYKPELIIVASYGQMIPENILNYPKYKVLNIHVSLLPDLRGAVPMPMAILKGYKETGVSIQIMEKGLDEGDIIGERKFDVSGNETTETLTEKSSNHAANLIEEIIPKWIDSSITARPQDDSKATYCYQEDISKERAELTQKTSVDDAERMVRAFYPWPIAWFVVSEGKYKSKRVKVYAAKILTKEVVQNYNEIMKLVEVDGQLTLNLSDGVLVLQEVQLEGKERRGGEEYLWLIS